MHTPALLSALSCFGVLISGKPSQDVEAFYNPMFNDYDESTDYTDDYHEYDMRGVHAGEHAGSGASGDGSGDGFRQSATDEVKFMQQESYDIPSDIPVILLRQMLINSGYHDQFMRKKRRRRSPQNQDTMDTDYDYGGEVYTDYGYNDASDYDNHDNVDYTDHDINTEPDEEFSGTHHFRGGVEQNFDIVFDDQSHDIDTIVSLVINHGCWCPKLEGHLHYGGKPLDDVDKACRDWSKCLHCTDIVGKCGTSKHEPQSTMTVVYTGTEYYCSETDNNPCTLEKCQCLLDWAVSTKAVIDVANAKVPNEDIYTDVDIGQCKIQHQKRNTTRPVSQAAAAADGGSEEFRLNHAGELIC